MLTRTVLALVVAPGLLLSGCGDGDPAADPTRSPATSQSPETSDGTPTGSPSPTSSVEPAAGPLVEDDVFSYRLPADAEWDLGRGGLSASAYDEELNAFDVATTAVALQAGNSGEDLDADFESSTYADPYDPPRKRGENRVIDGVEGWTAQTVDDDGRLIYTFGAMHARHSFDITFRFPEKDPRSVEWIEATLASIQWK